MKASILILAGLTVFTAVGLTACETTPRERTRYVDVRSERERAQQCVAAFEPDGKAPQVMTYDSKTGTEVHMNQDGRRVDVTAQNASDNTALGMGGKVGGKIPEACTDADPLPGAALPKDRSYKTTWNSQK
ncbi:hypothetical protein ABI_10860 [Asticcacaulis biprosthecium C19]|uniref:Lipoprotein n=1 Tax=Asticcacaulis biprosthecium C19 TaxID=715226 RepID=F4QHB2_9CAUL|nr:hypothetical protein [Asticcacaulis biprosthecium]EGF92649.1 hypothetical protein ABI_10860 [Asticcacaulis biprosthecium C19]